jgi:hypothetical protein
MSPPSSSLPPAGVPDSGGNAKYAVIAVLLLLAAGGLFAWRSLSGHGGSAPAVVNAPPPLQPPSNPKIEDVPLPPPPEEKPEGGTGPRIIYVPAGGCTETCSGKAPPELASVIQVRAQQARRCYDQALASDSSLKGKVSIELRIGPAGNVCSANVISNDMGSPVVANCVANRLRASGGFPAPRGGCVAATVPFAFVPQGGQGGP